MNEERLHELAKRLGTGAAERLDVEATARRVVERLREQPVQRTTWFSPAWLRIAAAVVVLVGGALVARQFVSSGDSHAAHLVTEDLGDLSTDELREVLSTLDATLESGPSASSDSSLDELNAQQLRAVLRSLEG